MSGVQHQEVKSDEDGMRVDRWFRSHFPALTQGRLQKMLRKGDVRVDSGRVKADHRLAAGQTVRVPPIPDGKAPAPAKRRMSDADRQLAEDMVIYRDPEVIVLNKPAGLAVQGGTGVKKHVDGLLPALKYDYPDAPRLVHRLDKDTSGVLVLGRTRVATQWLTKAFRDRQTEKTYWALVAGTPRPHQGTINLRLSKEDTEWGEQVAPVETGGQRAISHYAVISHAGQRAAWLAMRPVTGRTHQLRVHAAAIECPIIGDFKYGGDRANEGGFDWGMFLHARQLVLARPDGRMLDVTAEAPKGFVDGLHHLGFELREAVEAEIEWPEGK
jgi:23S rRNA pseudouridine955/2504/2580 synthase